MNNLEVYQNLILAFRDSMEYDSLETKELRFDSNVPDIKTVLENAKIEIEEKYQKLCFEKSTLPFSYYNNYLEYKSEVTQKALNKDCVIHDYAENSYLWYESHSNSTFEDEIKVESNFLFSNTKIYFEFLEFLEQKAEHNLGEPDFTDFYSKTNRKIILASVSDKKRITFTYPQTGLPELDFSLDYSKDFREFVRLFSENNYYPIFLKNSIISNLSNGGENLFSTFFESLNKINLDAKLNFNVYLHQLSLDKIKAEYKEYKQKYYSSQSDILSKISSQVLALPISIAGSAFALYKLEDAKFALALICLGLVGFIIYLSNMMNIYWNDLKTLKKQMGYDYQAIKNQDFFIENETELNHFKFINDDLTERVRKLKNSLKIFSGCIWVMDVSLIIYGVSLIFELDTAALVMLFLAGMLIYAVLDVYVIFPKEKDNKF